MKKKHIYLVFVLVLVVAVAGIIYKYKSSEQEEAQKTYTLLQRKGADANSTEWRMMKQKCDTLAAIVAADPYDTKSALKLATVYIQEARITGNNSYYDMAALRTINDILAVDPNNFEALVYKALVFYSQHHFAEGLAIARQAQKINPYNAYVYGLMVDGNVEMGNYDSAVANADKMVSIRPDLTSYSRISYLREINGNYPAAIEAMKMAVQAGGPGDEYTEWSRIQLAQLFEKIGDYRTADTIYQNSLVFRPNYAFALAGLGRVAFANKDYKKAIQYYQRADSIINDFTIKDELADAYRMAGQTAKADEIQKQMIKDLQENAQAGNDDAEMGHYADRELAYAYLKVNDKDKALEHALLEYNRRPENIDVNETVAWVYYNRGEYAKALPYMKAALRTNSKNPVLLSRAALVYFKSGDKSTAKTLLAETSQQNPYIDYALKSETSGIIPNL
jgi:tetratricopeptide (TPR) repeat protein